MIVFHPNPSDALMFAHDSQNRQVQAVKAHQQVSFFINDPLIIDALCLSHFDVARIHSEDFLRMKIPKFHKRSKMSEP